MKYSSRACSRAVNEDASKTVHGLVQLVNPKPTDALVRGQSQHDVALVKSLNVPGGHALQSLPPPALPELPAPHCDGAGTAKLMSVAG